MTEKIPQASDDEFDKIMKDLSRDDDFVSMLDELDSKMEKAELAKLSVINPHHEGYKQFKPEQPMDIVISKINSIFKRLCLKYGVDPSEPGVDEKKLISIQEALVDEANGLKEELSRGDIIVASETIVLDLIKDSQDVRVVELTGSVRVVGAYSQIVLSPTPIYDDSSLEYNLSESGLSVGLVIDKPFILDIDGTAYLSAFMGDRAVIPLGLARGKLSRWPLPDDA